MFRGNFLAIWIDHQMKRCVQEDFLKLTSYMFEKHFNMKSKKKTIIAELIQKRKNGAETTGRKTTLAVLYHRIFSHITHKSKFSRAVAFDHIFNVRPNSLRAIPA